MSHKEQEQSEVTEDRSRTLSFVELKIDAPHVVPPIKEKDGTIVGQEKGNLDDFETLADIEAGLLKLPNFYRHIVEGKGKARYYPVVGGLVVIATLVGVEVGLRHCRDIHEVVAKIQAARQKLSPLSRSFESHFDKYGTK